MFGFLKNWLGKSDEQSRATTVAPPPKTSVPTAPAARATSERPVAPVVDVVMLPLAAIFGKLPSDLQGRVKLPINGQAQVAIPLGVILPQLGRGAVTITFGELRALGADCFLSPSDRDAAVVELPLPEILSRLDPALLPRRAKSTVKVPNEITSPFSGKGQGLNFYKPEATPTVPLARKTDDSVVSPDFAEPNSAPVVTPPPEPAPVVMPAISAPAYLNPRPAATVASAEPATPRPAAAGTVLTVTLRELAEAWPASIRTEIGLLNLTAAKVELPKSLVEEALKKGRAVFTWRQLRFWTNTPAAATVSVHDAELLELPLKLIAPLFLAGMVAARPARPAAVDASIPDLFSAAGRPKPTAPVTPAAPAVTPPAEPAAGKPTPIVFADTEITGKTRSAAAPRPGTEFLKRFATPNDIVAKATSLEGVTGAIIMLADGLLVAAQLPPNLNGDSLAAFTPQLYARLSQTAKEYHMGDLKELAFTVGETAWRVYKVGAVFFAAFGPATGALPLAQLAQLAAELDRKAKP